MVLYFDEIGINLADYNGYSFEKIRPLIINQAVDYILSFDGDYDYEVFDHYEWEIDYILRKIIIPQSALA
jgi:hypothetical protein